MARLYLSPGSQSYGPVPGGEVSQTFGSNDAERLTLAANANVVLDPSFVRGNDCIVILGEPGSYNIVATVVGITITSSNGANIRIPAFGNTGGLKLDFNGEVFDIGTYDGGTTFFLEGASSTQDIGSTPSPITIDGGSGGTASSLDIGTATVAANVNAGTDGFAFSDNAEATTNVKITGFTSDDKITVTNALASDYNFQRDFADINDLRISYTDPGTGAINTYLIDEVLPNTGAVNSFASATAAMGFEFMTFA